jgi:Ser-tRNA(Ala) deacylase AlaX
MPKIAEIVGVDWQADGGCRIQNLREAGKVKLVKTETKCKKTGASTELFTFTA